MESRRNFKRFFMVFEKDKNSSNERELSGHLKIITRSGKGKLEAYFTGLNIDTKHIYTLYLISNEDLVSIKVKEIVPSSKRIKIEWTFDAQNVGDSNKFIDEFNVVVLKEYNQLNSNITYPLVAYKENKVDWKDNISKILSAEYNISNNNTSKIEHVTSNQLVSSRPKPKNVIPKNIDKSIEIKQLRTKSNKYYINPNKTQSVEVTSSPIYFKNNRGKLQEIDNELIHTNELGYSYTNKDNDLKVFLAINNDNGKLVRLKVDSKKWIDLSPDKPFSMLDLESKSIHYINKDNNIQLNYYINGGRLKEEIVLLKQPTTNTLEFNITTEGLYLEKSEEGFIWVKDIKNSENVFKIDKPTAFDNKGKVNRNIFIDIVENKLTMILNNEWLKSASYPVRIDPTITNILIPGAIESRDTYASDFYPQTKYYDSNYLHAGTRFGKTRSFIKFENLPQLGTVVKEIKKAYLKLYMYFEPQTADDTIIDLHQITQDWQSSTLDWIDQPSYKLTPEYSLQSREPGEWTFDITNLVNKWYSTYPSQYGQAANFGVMLKARNELNERRSFYSGDNPFNQPKLVLEYETNPIGIEPFWHYDGDVNIHNGNLVFSEIDVSLQGRGIPISVTRTYNSRSSMFMPYNYGYGWSYNMDIHLNYVDGSIVTFTNSDGTKYFFARNDDGTFKSPPGVYLSLHYENNKYNVETKAGIKYYFNSTGKLDYIIDTDNNTTSISYDTSGNISTMTDSSGRFITFNVSNGKLRTITGEDIPTVEYGYDAFGNLLSVVKRNPTDQSILDEVHYSYEDPNDINNITTITDAENNTVDIEYYNDDKVRYIVKSMTSGGIAHTLITQYEYSLGENDTTITTVTYPKGNKAQYTTNINGNLIEKISDVGTDPGKFNLTTNLQWDAEQNLVEINNPKNYSYIFGYNDNGDIEQINIPGNYSSIYHYNTLGDIINSIDYIGRTNIDNYNSDTRSKASSSNPWFASNIYDYDEYGNVIQRTNLLSIGANLLHNPGFERWSGGIPSQWIRPNTGGNIIDDVTEKVNGIHSVKMISTGTSDSKKARLQSVYIPIKPNSKYNISWSVKTDNVGNTNGGATVSVYWFDKDDGSSAIGQSFYVAKSIGTNDWIRKSARVDSPSNAIYAKVEISVNDVGTAWFDNIQFLLGSVINNYNMLINYDFEQLSDFGADPNYWEGFNFNESDGVNTTYSHSGNRSVVINGEIGINKYFQQVLNVRGPEGTIFRFSGWSKTEGTFTTGPYLGITLIYEDNSVDYFGINFSPNEHDWEYNEGLFETKNDFKEIMIYGKLNNQTGTVWYDDFSLRLNGAPNALINGFNLVENGSFEYDIDGTNWPDGWPKDTNYDNVPGTYDISYISSSGNIATFHGDKMIRISDVPSWAVVESMSIEPLKSGKTYIACAAIKTENVTGSGAIVKIDMLDSNNNLLGEKRSKPVTGTNDWKRVAVTLSESEAKALYPNAAKISVSVGTADATSGIMYFDAVLFREDRVETEYDYGDTNGNYITSITNPRGKTVNILPSSRGNVEQIMDPKGNSTTFQYNLIDQLEHLVNALGLKTKITYDKNGYATKIEFIDDNIPSLINKVEQQYNELNLVLSSTDQLNKNLTFEYTSNANIEKINKADGEVMYLTYDGADRLDTVTYNQDTRTWSYEYDNNSNITKIIQNTSEITQFTYDELDRITKLTYPGGNHNIDYIYNPSGQILNITYSKLLTEPIFFSYDQSGLNVKIDGPNNSVVAYMYDQNGLIVKSFKSSGGSTFYISYMYYDQVGNIIMIRTEDNIGNKISEYKYTYDDNGNRESEHNTISDEYINFNYDVVNQLINEKYYYNKDDQTPYREGQYNYDLLGNLKSRTIILDGNTTERTFNYNLANEVVNTGYMHDENGNLISDGYRTYVYNASNQLILVKEGENIIVQYEYNALGLRSRKATQSMIERYYYSGDQLSYIADDNGELRFFFTYDPSAQRLNMIDYTGASGTEETYWYEYDAHGNVIGLLDKNGNMVITYKYDAWGNIISSTGTINTVDGTQSIKDANPFRYSGYFYDNETVFYYLKARYYTPYLQRFITRDTFIGINPYLYTGNNPVGRIDYDGRRSLPDALLWLKLHGAPKEFYESVPVSKGANNNASNNSTKELEEATKNSAIGATDVIVSNIFQKYPSTTVRSITKVPQLGPAAHTSTYTVRSGLKALKGISKVTGTVAVVATGYELYQDYYNYSGDERIGAMAITTVGTVASIGIGIGVASIGLTLAPAIAFGAFVGGAIGVGVNFLKKKLFG